MNSKPFIAPDFSEILLVGTGGTGGYLATGLAKIIAGYKLPVEMTLIDPDTVEEANLARQEFMPWELGLNKAKATAERLNERYALAIGACDLPWQSYRRTSSSPLVISCVDNIEARKTMKESSYWLDLGNGRTQGQVIFGTTAYKTPLKKEAQRWKKSPIVGNLPNAYLMAGMKNLKTEKKMPSCAQTPFDEQGVMVNQWAAQAGLAILHQLLVLKEVSTPAIYFDTAKARMLPAQITKDYLSV
jgi:PRTRC genetic system ThiF family protein